MSDVAQPELPDLSSVADDVWLDALFWIERAEVGIKLALIDARFDRLVNTHFNLRKWKMGELTIQRAPGGDDTTTTKKAAVVVMDNKALTKWLPVATNPAPAGIIGFVSIQIWYVDMEVIAFLKLLRRIISQGITLQFSIHTKELRCWALMSKHIWPLISHAITTLYDMKIVDYSLLFRHMSSNVLFDCTNLRTIINSHMFPARQPPTFHANESLLSPTNVRGETPKQQMFRWLHTPRPDGRPKILTFRKSRPQWTQMMGDLISFFHVSNAIAVNYLITCVGPSDRTQKFNRENERTHEQLVATTHSSSPFSSSVKAVVVRHPIGIDQRTLNTWERETRQLINLLYINIKESDIGPEMLAELMPMSIE